MRAASSATEIGFASQSDRPSGAASSDLKNPALANSELHSIEMALPNLFLLEHLNLTVADKALAVAFYVDALGCGLNSVVGSETITHVNFGLSQFHLPKSSAPDTSQKWDGVIFLQTVTPLETIVGRLTSHPLLSSHGNIRSDFIKPEEDGATPVLQVTGPYGNQFHIQHDPALNHFYSHLGHHHGLSSEVAALPRVLHWCQTGTAGTSP